MIYGGAGSDVIDGGAGSDTIYGGAADDVLYGGDDTIYDTLYGEDGNDQLTLGAGVDTPVAATAMTRFSVEAELTRWRAAMETTL